MVEWMIYLLLSALTGIVLFRIFRYASTPLFKKSGYYKYYSPMFFIMPTPVANEIHLGTSYDFFKHECPSPIQLMHFLAEGMVAFSDAIRDGKVEMEKPIRGTIYYFNDEALRRFGFDVVPLTPFQRTMFLINYVELCVLHSLSKRRISFINVAQARRVSAMPSTVAANREKYETIRQYFVVEDGKVMTITGRAAKLKRQTVLTQTAVAQAVLSEHAGNMTKTA